MPGRESSGRVTALGVEAILAVFAGSRRGKHRARVERGRRQACQRLVAGRIREGTNNPRGRQAARRSDSGVVKRSNPRSRWAQPVGWTQIDREQTSTGAR
jgi:hypothetical protein